VLLAAVMDDLLYERADVERLEIAPVLTEVSRQGLRLRASPPGPRERDARAPAGGTSRSGAGGAARAEEAAEAEGRRLFLTAGGAPAEERPGASVTALATSGDAFAGPAYGSPRSRPSAALARTGIGSGARSDAVLFSFRGDFSDAENPSDVVDVRQVVPAGRIDERLFMLSAPDSPAAAAFRVLRHRLDERRAVGKAVLVTSPGAGEGKTLTAVNLALALGEAGRARVLLVEANFRSPSIAAMLAFEPPVGFAEQFALRRAQPGTRWTVVETLAPWLHALAVAPAAEPRPMLDGRALAECIDDLRRARYDYIVVDSPSVLDSADVNLIDESVDAILFALRARTSRARTLRKAAEQIGTSKLLGVVLLGT
jgi:Mrp family chromosome partitioning ATPase